MTNNHPAHGPVSLDRLRQIREILSKASAQSDGGNLGYAMADAVKVIDGALELRKADATPEFHTEASRFLPECLKAEEISGERRNSRIAELIGWFDRYYNGKANPKWFKSHTAELCYYILTAPPAPVVPEEKRDDDGNTTSEFDYGWNACRAAMLQSFGNSEQLDEVGSWNNHRNTPTAQAGNSPAVPDGWVTVPKKLTAENGAKGVLSGEFSETKFINCPECFGDDECETCDGSGRIEITVPVSWTNIKAIWAKGVEHFEAAPQQEVKP